MGPGWAQPQKHDMEPPPCWCTTCWERPRGRVLRQLKGRVIFPSKCVANQPNRCQVILQKNNKKHLSHSSWFYSVLLLCVHLGHGVWSQYIQRKDDVETELEKEKIYQQQLNVRKRRRTSFLRIFPQSSSGRWLLPENVPSCCSTDLFPVSSRPRAAWREVMKTESGSGGDES